MMELYLEVEHIYRSVRMSKEQKMSRGSTREVETALWATAGERTRTALEKQTSKKSIYKGHIFRLHPY